MDTRHVSRYPGIVDIAHESEAFLPRDYAANYFPERGYYPRARGCRSTYLAHCRCSDGALAPCVFARGRFLLPESGRIHC